MPYSITTKDGITIDNIPDDVPPDSPDLKAQVASMRASMEQPYAEAATVEQAAPQEQGIVDQLGRQLGLTARAVGEGAAGTVGIFSDPIAIALNKILPPEHQATMARDTISALLTKAGVPEPETATERIIQQASQAVVGGGGFVGAGRTLAGAASPVIAGVGESLAAQPVQQLAGAAGAGASAQGAQEAGLGPVAQLGAGLAGGIAGAGLAGLRTAPRATDARIAAATEAEQRGIPVMTSDVMPPGTFAAKWLQSTGEKIPLAGTGKAREVQQMARADAVRNLLLDFGADDAAKAPANVMTDLAKKRSSDLIKYSTLKNEVIDRLDGAGQVPVDSAVREIDGQIAKLTSLRSEGVNPVIARLEDFKASIQGQGLRNIEELRKQLGEAFKAPELTSVRGIGDKAVSSIYGALRKDMGDFIKSAGERRDLTKWEVANKRLSEMSGELKMGTLKSVLSRGEATPEVINGMLFSSKPSEVQQLYRGLTPKGRANAQVAILARATEKAGGIENISPDKFANEVERLGKSVGVFFSGDDLNKVKGLTRALELTKRGGQAGVAPPTGVQVAIPVGAAVLTDMLGGAGAATATGAGVGIAARIYESPAVRNLLVKIPKVQKGSKEEAALVKRLISTIQSQQETIEE